jgi:hypothetical protein
VLYCNLDGRRRSKTGSRWLPLTRYEVIDMPAL